MSTTPAPTETTTAPPTQPASTAPEIGGPETNKSASVAVASPEPGATPVVDGVSPSAPTPAVTSVPAPELTEAAASEQESTPAPAPAHAPGPTPAAAAASEPAPTPALTSPPPSEPTASVTAPTPAPEPTATPVALASTPEATSVVTSPTAQEPTAAPVASPTPGPDPTSASEAKAMPTTSPAPESASLPVETVGAKAEKQAHDDEPQNSLTTKFTEKEWKAVKELRQKLPDILEKAYDKPDAKTTPITLWGVHIDPSQPKDAKVSVVLAKFLRARNLSVHEAEKMFVATLRWREEFKVEEAVKEEFPKEIFGQLGHVYGKDQEGRPVVYNLYGANKDTKAVFGDVQRFLRWRVALMEKSISCLDFETIDQTVQIHDYEGVSLTQRDANSKSAASEATSIFQNHYPEFLYRKFFINVPTLLTWIFWVFKPLLSPATIAKMTVVGTGHHAIAKALLPIINKTELPKKYGGEAAGF